MSKLPLFLVVPIFAWLSAQAGLVVKVDPAGGAPRITVDGLPVDARMFFGNPGSRPLQVDAVGGFQTFDFTALEGGTGGGTMHFRFGDGAGEVDLGEIEVTDITTGQKVIAQPSWDVLARDWIVYPPKTTSGTVTTQPNAKGRAMLHVTLQEDTGATRSAFHLAHQPDLEITGGHQYHVSLWARASPSRRLSVGFYSPERSYLYLGGPEAFEEQIKLASDAGVNFVSFNVVPPWNQPGVTPDWSGIDARCREILAANPNALLIPRIHLRPPAWWLAAHPGDLMVYDLPNDGGDSCVYSPSYRRDAAATLDVTVRHLEASFGDHVAGYHPAGQNTDEWFYDNSWKKPLNGYGKVETSVWRDWVATTYPTDAALRAAWNNRGATLEGVMVPAPETRRASPFGTLRDPEHERELIDFAAFQQQMMADTLGQFAHVIRQATQGRKLVLVFYGYGFTFASMGNGPATSGHYALREVLDSPDIDLICAPIAYNDRQLGGGGPTMNAGESVALAGKMLLREDDTFTFLAEGEPPGHDAGLSNLDDTRMVLRRNVGVEALRNYATWWMDLGSIGWFDDVRLWDEMRGLHALDEAMLKRPRAYRPEVAAVLDEKTMRLVTPAGVRVTGPIITAAQTAFDRLGTPSGQYLQDDVIHGRVNAKLLVFLDAWQLDSVQRKALLAASRGKAKIWCYAPGYLDGDRPSLAAMRELTGFKLEEISSAAALARPTLNGAKAGLTVPFGVNALIKPLFAARDATPEETLATYPDGAAAVALRETPEGPSLFVGVPGLTPEILRLMAARAGVHLYTRTDCNVTANGPFIVVHGATDGAVALDIGAPSAVFDGISNAKIGDGPVLDLPLHKGETRVLSVRP